MNQLDNLNTYYIPNTLDGINIVSESISTDALLVDGTNMMLADIDMNFHVLKNLDAGIADNESVNVAQLNQKANIGYVDARDNLYDASMSQYVRAQDTAYDTSMNTFVTTQIANLDAIVLHRANNLTESCNGLKTFTNLLTVNAFTGAGTTATFRTFQDTNYINLLPKASAGSYNPLVSVNDGLIYASTGTVDTGALTLGCHSNTKSGVRITPTTVQVEPRLGVGMVPNASYALDVTGFGRISSRLGIGIATTPSHPLHVSGNGYFTGILGVGATPSAGYSISTSTGIQAALGNLFLADGNALLGSAGRSSIYWTDPDDAGYATINLGSTMGTDATTGNTKIKCRSTGLTEGIQFHLGYQNDSVQTTVEKMRMTASGRLGIATTNPADKLHIYDGTEARMFLSNPTYRWAMSSSSNRLNFYNDIGSNGSFEIVPNSAATKFRCDTNGVGINGLTNASYALNVTGDSNVSGTANANAVSAVNITATTGNITATSGDIKVNTIGSKGFQIGNNPSASQFDIGARIEIDNTIDDNVIISARTATTNGRLNLAYGYSADGIATPATKISIGNTITMNGRLIMSSNRISNVADPTQAQDAMTRNFADNNFVGIANAQTITGAKTFNSAITMGSVKITGLANGTVASDAVNYSQLSSVDSGAVHKTGNETIDGIKTFTSSPVIPNATLSTQATAYGQLTAVDASCVHLYGNETISGIKTFNSSPIVPTATTTTQAVNKGQMDNEFAAKERSRTQGPAVELWRKVSGTDVSIWGMALGWSIDIHADPIAVTGSTGLEYTNVDKGVFLRTHIVLYKGDVINGFFFSPDSNTGAATVKMWIYDWTDNLVATTDLSTVASNKLTCFLPFTTAWTVPSTQTYKACLVYQTGAAGVDTRVLTCRSVWVTNFNTLACAYYNGYIGQSNKTPPSFYDLTDTTLGRIAMIFAYRTI